MKILLRLLGVRIIEGPESIRASVPKWMGDKVARKVERQMRENNPDMDVRRHGRNIIVRYPK